MDRTLKSKIQHLSGENHLQAHRANFLHDVLVPSKLPDDQVAPIAFIAPSAPAVHQPSMTLASRDARATAGNKLMEFVSQMELIARVANGATLVNGFVNGTIPGNIVIAELLHMGSLTPDELIAMKDSDVSQLFQPLSALSADLVDNPDLVKLENNYIAMNDALNSNLDMDAVTNLVNRTAYETQLGVLSNTTINVNSATNAVVGLLSQLSDVAGSRAEFQTNPDNVVNTIGSISLGIPKLETQLSTFQLVLTFVTELKNLVELSSSFLQLLTNEYEARKGLMIEGVNPTAKNDINSNFQMFNHQSANLDAQKQRIGYLHGFLNSRTSLSPPTFKHTAGFPKGRESLDPLDMDTIRPSLTSRLNGTKQSSGHLQRGLRPLDGFNSKMKAVEKAWDLANPKVNSAKKIFKLVDGMVVENSRAQTRIDKANDFKNCQVNLNPYNITLISTARQPIENLNSAILKISNFNYIDDLKNLKPLKDIVTYTKNASDDQKKAETPEMLNKLGKYDVAGLIKKLELFKSEISHLETIVTNRQNTVTEIQNGLRGIDSYHKQLNETKFGNLLGCLKPIGTDGALVANMIESIREIRAMKGTQDVADAQGYLTTIKSSSTVLQTALDSVRDFKNLTTPEVKSLSEFKKESVSQDLGMAVQGMLVIEKLESNRQRLDALTGDVKYIANATEKYANVGNFSEHYTRLKTIDSLKTNLVGVLTGVDKVKTAVENLKGTDLKSYGTVFTAAKDLQSMQTDFKKWKAAVEALKQLDPSLQQGLDNVITSLDTLRELDLDFVKYKFASAPAALGELQLYFANYNSASVSNSAAAAGGNAAQSPQDVQIVNEETSVLKGIGLIVVGIIVAIAVIIAIAIIYIMCRRKKKETATNELIKTLFRATDEILEQLENSPETLLSPRQYFIEQLMVFDQLNEPTALSNEIHKLKRRVGTIYRNEKNAVQLNPVDMQIGKGPVFIHANFMQFKDSTWILAQGPLDGSEVDDPKANPPVLKENTCETHWQMIDQKEVTLIVQLCDFIEDGKPKCAQYYPLNSTDQTHGHYTVSFVGEQPLKKEFTALKDKYSLVKVEYHSGGRKKAVDILRFFGWPDESSPKETQPCLEMIKFAEKHKSVLVHCSTGVGRTGTLAGIKKGMELSELGQMPGINTICISLRECRRHAMQNEQQLLYLMLVMTKGLINNTNNKSFVKSYAALRWYYNKMIDHGWQHQDETTKLWENDEKYKRANMDLTEQHEFVENQKTKWEKAHKKAGKKGTKEKGTKEKGTKEKGTKEEEETGEKKDKKSGSTTSESGQKSVEKSVAEPVEKSETV